jgi:hypothetical protein
VTGAYQAIRHASVADESFVDRHNERLPYRTLHPTNTTMNRSGGEAFAKLAQQLNRARLQAQGGGGGKGGGGGQMPGFKGFMAGGGLLAVLAGGGLILNYSLFNGMSPLLPFRS